MTHFKLTRETIKVSGVTLYRIELTKKCKWGNIGDKGGFVEKKSNLNGDAWVYGNAKVYGNAEVYGDAKVNGDAWNTSPLQIVGTRHFINVSKKNHLTIGCKEFTFGFWKKNFKRIGKENDYTEEEIAEYRMYINLAVNLYSKKQK